LLPIAVCKTRQLNDLCAVLVCDHAIHITNIGYRLAGELLVILSQIHFLSQQNVGFVS
jgi:hypothetical protein